LLFPVRQEDVDVMESYFSDGYRQENDAGLSHLNHEEEQKVPDSEEGHWIGQGLSRDGINVHTEPLNGEGHGNDVDIGDFDDLILQEEDEETPPPSTLTSDPKTAANSLTFPAVESQETSAEAATHPTSHPVSTIEPQTGAASSYQKNASTISSASSKQGLVHARGTPHLSSRQYAQVQGGNVVDYGTENNKDLDQIITDVATGASKTISRIGRINLAEGWDVGTSPQEKSEDLCLGLRDGLCGALSSFSSWMSSMANLFRTGDIGQAFVGLILGIQLPLIAYRSGQYVSVYIFVWRCRREKRRDERRGYGLRLQTDEEGSVDDDLAFNLSAESIDTGDEMSTSASHRAPAGRTKGLRTVHDEDSEVPSVRAVITALFIMCLVAQITSLQFFYEPDDRLLALSLLFSPLGVLARWRMMKFNAWRPNFPIGTFACNVTACALSGSLGRLLAGNPGPRQSIALVAIIDGFAGTLSSVARFIVEILSLMDPILFRLDGLYYAVASAFWGLLISFIFSASGDWADSVDKES
jgi:fluoride ion exporter CrcB/FEX